MNALTAAGSSDGESASDGGGSDGERGGPPGTLSQAELKALARAPPLLSPPPYSADTTSLPVNNTQLSSPNRQ